MRMKLNQLGQHNNMKRIIPKTSAKIGSIKYHDDLAAQHGDLAHNHRMSSEQLMNDAEHDRDHLQIGSFKRCVNAIYDHIVEVKYHESQENKHTKKCLEKSY